MQTITVECRDNAMADHIYSLLSSLPKNKVKVTTLHMQEKASNKPYPIGIVASSANDVRARIKEAELGEDVSNADYKKEMRAFFINELKIR